MRPQEPAIEQLAKALPPDAVEQLARVLLRVDHAGTTRIEIHHGPAGQVTDVDIAPPTRRIKIQRRA